MKQYAFDPSISNLRGRVTLGAAQTGVTQGVKLLTQIGSAIWLSHLLSPSDFGISAMAGPTLAFVMLFQDLGLNQATVQKPTITHEEVSSLFWINTAMSVALAVVLILVGPLVGNFYHDSRAGWLTSAMSVLVLIYGFGAQPAAILTRRMSFGYLAMTDAAGAVAALGVSIAWTFVQDNYWALFVGMLAGAAIPTIGMWIAAQWMPSRPRLVAGSRDLLGFGAGITGFNVSNFFARNLDKVLIGRFSGDLALGLYDRAYKLLLFPLQQINNPLARVMVPALSRLNNDPDRYRNAFFRTMGQLLLISLPGIVFMAAMSDVLVPTLLGEKWRGAAPIFGALGFAGVFQTLNNPSGWLFISQGRSTDFMRWGIFGAVTSIIAFAIGLPHGPVGVATCYAISEVIRTPILWWYVGKKGSIKLPLFFSRIKAHFFGALMSLLFILILKPSLSSLPLIQLSEAFILSYSISILMLLLFTSGRATLRETQSLFLVGLRRLRF